MTTAHPLAVSLDTAAAAPLRLALLHRIKRHERLLLDGAAVTKVGIACLQVLASARLAASAEGLAYRVVNPSDALRTMAALAHLGSALDPVGEKTQP